MIPILPKLVLELIPFIETSPILATYSTFVIAKLADM